MKIKTLVMAGIWLLFAPAVMAADPINVEVNGAAIDFAAYDQTLPYIENDYTLVPLRAVAEALGFEVDWDSRTKTVTASREALDITLVIDSSRAVVNGETVMLAAPARITGGRTFVPLRFIAECTGAVVDWDRESKTVTITTGTAQGTGGSSEQTGETKNHGEITIVEQNNSGYSGKLNGFWEEGYHYYLEFNDERLTVRDYRRAIALETTVSYDAEAIEKNDYGVITLADHVLSRDAMGEPFTMIQSLTYDRGEIKLLYDYTIMGETLYTLHKVERGPFAHIRIRDAEYLDFLQGEWKEWRANGNGSTLVIKGNRLTWLGEENSPFHVVSYEYRPDAAYIVPENLIDDSFAGFLPLQIYPDMLTTTILVMDASMPLTVFARPDQLDTIRIPEAAKRPVVNMMAMPDEMMRQEE